MLMAINQAVFTEWRRELLRGRFEVGKLQQVHQPFVRGQFVHCARLHQSPGHLPTHPRLLRHQGHLPLHRTRVSFLN